MDVLQHLFRNLENEPESMQKEASLIAKEIQETDDLVKEKAEKSNHKLIGMGIALGFVAFVTFLQNSGILNLFNSGNVDGVIGLGVVLTIFAVFMALNALQKQPAQIYRVRLKELERKLNQRAAKFRAKHNTTQTEQTTAELDDVFQFLFTNKKTKTTIKSSQHYANKKGPFKSRKDKVISGVIGGLAQSWGVNPFYLRLAVLCLIPFTSGAMIPIYIVASMLMPKEPTID